MRKAKLLLTLAMAAAVVSTAAVSFAQWDTLSATATGTVTLDSPVTVTATTATGVTYDAASRELGVAPAYEGKVTFATDTASFPAGKTPQLDLSTKVMNGEADVTNDFTVAYAKKDDQTFTGSTDKSVDASNEYTVTLTPNGDAAPDYADGSTALTVTVTAELGVVAAS